MWFCLLKMFIRLYTVQYQDSFYTYLNAVLAQSITNNFCGNSRTEKLTLFFQHLSYILVKTKKNEDCQPFPCGRHLVDTIICMHMRQTWSDTQVVAHHGNPSVMPQRGNLSDTVISKPSYGYSDITLKTSVFTVFILFL